MIMITASGMGETQAISLDDYTVTTLPGKSRPELHALFPSASQVMGPRSAWCLQFAAYFIRLGTAIHFIRPGPRGNAR